MSKYVVIKVETEDDVTSIINIIQAYTTKHVSVATAEGIYYGIETMIENMQDISMLYVGYKGDEE